MVIWGPIDFLFGLPINLNVNVRQKEFDVHIFLNVAKITNSRPKKGQIPLLSLNIIWHNSVIFDVLYFKLLVFSRRIEWSQKQSFISFASDFGVWPHLFFVASHG